MASTTASTCWGGVWEITTPVRRSMKVMTWTPSERCEHSTPTFFAGASMPAGGATGSAARSPAATAGGTARTGPDWERVDETSMSSGDGNGGGPRGAAPAHHVRELAPQELQHLLRRLVGP